MQSTTRASPVHARCSKARRTHHAVQTTAKKADTKFQTTSEEKIICRREIVMKTGFLLATSAVLVSPKPALALFGFGEKSDVKYEDDTKAVIAQVREVLQFPMGSEGREQSIEKTRALTNEWVARYRRSEEYSGRPSYGLCYSALNAVSGHFNNFGTKYPFPQKRKDRVFEELQQAETQLSRGR